MNGVEIVQCLKLGPNYARSHEETVVSVFLKGINLAGI